MLPNRLKVVRESLLQTLYTLDQEYIKEDINNELREHPELKVPPKVAEQIAPLASISNGIVWFAVFVKGKSPGQFTTHSVLATIMQDFTPGSSGGLREWLPRKLHEMHSHD